MSIIPWDFPSSTTIVVASTIWPLASIIVISIVWFCCLTSCWALLSWSNLILIVLVIIVLAIILSWTTTALIRLTDDLISNTHQPFGSNRSNLTVTLLLQTSLFTFDSDIAWWENSEPTNAGRPGVLQTNFQNSFEFLGGGSGSSLGLGGVS